jgi:ATP-dependent 26S proteasome regulatory subunit
MEEERISLGTKEQKRATVLNQVLDGINSTPGVFVLGATNLLDRLDPAVLRGGRLGRKIEIPLPDEESRLRLFELFSAGAPLAADLDFKRLAALTGGMSGADIESLSNEAAELALGRDEGPRQITQADYERAVAGYRVAVRRRAPRTMPPTERGAGDQIR